MQNTPVSAAIVYNRVLDQVWHLLTGNEAKVFVYILRRTAGFQKLWDNISLHQFLHGVCTRAGKQLDQGVGLGKRALLGALRSLASKGLLEMEHRSDPRRGHLPTRYCIPLLRTLMDESPQHHHLPSLAPQAPAPPRAAAESGQVEAPCGNDEGVGADLHQGVGSQTQQVQGIVVQGSHEPSSCSACARETQIPPIPTTTPDDEKLIDLHPSPTPANPLLDQLLGVGISAGMARRLVKQRSAEQITLALENLPHRQADNPAAYLVRELLDGDFAPPTLLANLTPPTPQAPAETKPSKALLAEQARQEQVEREETALAEQAQAVLAQLSEAEQHALLEQARAKVRSWCKRPEALAEGSPLVQSALTNLVVETHIHPQPQERSGGLRLDVPRPAAWSRLRRGQGMNSIQEVLSEAFALGRS